LTTNHCLSGHLAVVIYTEQECCLRLTNTPNFINKNTQSIFEFLRNHPQLSLLISYPPVDNIHSQLAKRLSTPTQSDRNLKHSYRYFDAGFLDQIVSAHLTDTLQTEHTLTNHNFREFFPDHQLYNYIKHTY